MLLPLSLLPLAQRYIPRQRICNGNEFTVDFVRVGVLAI